MKRKQTTAQILKERLSVLAVIVICLMMVVISQEARQFFKAQPPKPTATTIVAATPSPPSNNEPGSASQATPQPASSSAQSPSKPVKLTGKWVGTFSEVVEGVTYDYNYTLELSQQGTFISGKSIIEKQDDPGTFARFIVRGQVLPNTNPATIKFTEDLLSAQKLLSGSAAAPRITQLNYMLAEDGDHLDGEWADKTKAAQNVTGPITLSRQP